jgi:hypothetical protein
MNVESMVRLSNTNRLGEISLSCLHTTNQPMAPIGGGGARHIHDVNALKYNHYIDDRDAKVTGEKRECIMYFLRA